MAQRKKIGFVGLGNMGEPMAWNLVKKGYQVTVVYHTRKEPVEKIKAMGANVASSLKEMAEGSDVIISVVRDDAQTDKVIYGENGIWEGVKEGSIIILSSTINPLHCQEIAAAGKEKGVSVLDAPVSGARNASEAGMLTFMVGGDKAVFEECRPIFEAMGENIFHLGDVGMGETFKLVNNFMLFANMASASEAVALGLKAGLDLKRLLDVVKVSTGNSWVVQNWDSLVKLRKDYEQRKLASTLGMMYKDAGLGFKLAKDLGMRLPIAELVSQADISTFFPEKSSYTEAERSP